MQIFTTLLTATALFLTAVRAHGYGHDHDDLYARDAYAEADPYYGIDEDDIAAALRVRSILRARATPCYDHCLFFNGANPGHCTACGALCPDGRKQAAGKKGGRR